MFLAACVVISLFSFASANENSLIINNLSISGIDIDAVMQKQEKSLKNYKIIKNELSSNSLIASDYAGAYIDDDGNLVVMIADGCDHLQAKNAYIASNHALSSTVQTISSAVDDSSVTYNSFCVAVKAGYIIAKFNLKLCTESII